MDAILSIAGSIASIAGAIWALFEARKSAKSADAVKRMRSEMMDRRDIAHLSSMYGETKKIHRVIAQIGPTATPNTIKGVDLFEIATQVSVFVTMLTEHRGSFTGESAAEVGALLDALSDQIENLDQVKSLVDKRRFGKEVFNLIQSLIPIVKRQLDEKQDYAPDS